MRKQEKKNENQVTPEGAVEIEEEDLDAAAAGAGRVFPKVEIHISPEQKITNDGIIQGDGG